MKKDKYLAYRPFRVILILGVVLFAASLAIPAGAIGSWSVATSPNVGIDLNDLSAVSAVSSNNVWAVGDFRNSQSQYQTLIEHWNGTRWSVVPSPNVGTSYNLLNGVAARTATDAWAVGQAVNGTAYRTLIEHWNGSVWSVVSSPNIGTGDNILTAVTAIAANDVWAVGYLRNNNLIFQSLIEHWNGSTWSVVPSPNVANINNFLAGVAAISSTDVWAVGRVDEPGRTLTLHWNGTSWSIVNSPNTVIGESLLAGVSALSSNDVWAVGAGGQGTLTEHWDGTQWNIVSSPSPVPPQNGNNSLFGVVANSSTDVWAVGFSLNFTLGSLQQTITEHWDGTSWSLISSPNVGSSNNVLLGVTSILGTTWAVGHDNRRAGTPDRTLILRNP